MKREEKGWRELMEKRRGTNGFIPARGSGWQMGARPDAIPNAAGGEGGHGAATPDVAAHYAGAAPPNHRGYTGPALPHKLPFISHTQAIRRKWAAAVTATARCL